MTPISASVIYPELPDPLTPDDLQQLFSPSLDERQWAPTVVRAAESQVALLVQRNASGQVTLNEDASWPTID